MKDIEFDIKLHGFHSMSNKRYRHTDRSVRRYPVGFHSFKEYIQDLNQHKMTTVIDLTQKETKPKPKGIEFVKIYDISGVQDTVIKPSEFKYVELIAKDYLRYPYQEKHYDLMIAYYYPANKGDGSVFLGFWNGGVSSANKLIHFERAVCFSQTDTPSSTPNVWEVIELVCRDYTLGYDLMFCYNKSSRSNGVAYLGNFNDGIV